jgi:N-acylneuraminate cytidylyltransferase
MRVAGLVPARGGSKRVPGKNVRALAGHPLLAYAVAGARASGLFDRVMVSTDDEGIAAVARHYGADVPFLRPAAYAGDASPDIDWVRFTLEEWDRRGERFDAVSILRPTSPFRQAATIRRAWECFSPRRDAHSLRAVEKCRQHPGKMWVLDGDLMRPLLPGGPANPPWHSMPYQALPPVYAQNASLEIAWTEAIRDTGTIAGTRVVPFFTEGHEGFDINDASDWWLAEELIRRGAATPPAVDRPPFTP